MPGRMGNRHPSIAPYELLRLRRRRARPRRRQRPPVRRALRGAGRARARRRGALRDQPGARRTPRGAADRCWRQRSPLRPPPTGSSCCAPAAFPPALVNDIGAAFAFATRDRPRPDRRDPPRGRPPGPPPPQPDQAVEDAGDLSAAPAAVTLTPVRVLVVTNFMPDPSAPQRGRWVRDQVDEMPAPRHRGRPLRIPPRPGRVPAGDAAAAVAAAAAALRPRPRPLRPRRLGGAAGRGDNRWSSPSTAPTSATTWSATSRAGWPGGSTSSPRSRGRCFSPRTGDRGCRRSRAQRFSPAGPT